MNFLTWTYIVFPRQMLMVWRAVLFRVSDFFSLAILLRTLFYPWKAIWTSPKGLPLNEKIQAWAGNAIGRIIGFIARLFLVLLFIPVILISLLGGLVVLFFWYLSPILSLGAIFYGINLFLSK